ncbi:hypothetical protein Ocin01_10128 [Orchesella cincta]|uniref:Uncharacterized protein n=1 Tax=Orchesella cincta TaxID=48709 RepID=A0A1D2MUH7_ORCCI|nr:hypothetical protein Ocin01_10128 [Orchesella cincta]
MESATRLYCSFLLLAVVIICEAYPSIPAAVEQEFKVEGYQKDGDTQTIVLKIVPTNFVERATVLHRKPRQEEEDGGDDDVASTTPFIPAIIPGLTKIFTGLLTGNLNDIIHAPQSTPPTTRRPSVAEAEIETETEAPVRAPVTAAPASQASVGQPLAGSPLVSTQGSVTFDVTEAATTPTSNEDDEDESEGLLEFGRSVLKRNGGGKI